MTQRPDPQVALGEVIRARREELEKSQEEIGLASGTDQARVSRLEKGENPGYGLAKRVARALGWTLSELAKREEDLANEIGASAKRRPPAADRPRS